MPQSGFAGKQETMEFEHQIPLKLELSELRQCLATFDNYTLHYKFPSNREVDEFLARSKDENKSDFRLPRVDNTTWSIGGNEVNETFGFFVGIPFVDFEKQNKTPLFLEMHPEHKDRELYKAYAAQKGIKVKSTHISSLPDDTILWSIRGLDRSVMKSGAIHLNDREKK